MLSRIFQLFILFFLVITIQSSPNVFSKLKQGHLISLDRPKQIEIYSNNVAYLLDLDSRISFDYLKDRKVLGNEYFLYNFKKSPALLEPFKPNSTYDFSKYGTNWKQNLVATQNNDIILPNITSQISNCTSSSVQDFHDQVILVTRKHFVCSKPLSTLLTIQDVIDESTNEIDNSKVLKLLKNLNNRLKEKAPIVFIRIPENININTKKVDGMSIVQAQDLTVFSNVDKAGNHKYVWIFHKTQELSLDTISETIKRIFPDYFYGYIADGSGHSEHESDTGFKHDLEDFYTLYSNSLNQIRSKLKHLFESDSELYNKLMYTFEAEELSRLIKKLEEIHDEMYYGTYEILTNGLNDDVIQRLKNLTESTMEIVGHQMLDELAVEIKKNKGWFSKYKLSIIAGVAFCVYFSFVVVAKLKEKGKKIV